MRKSDQLRQRGAVPTLLMGQATAVASKQTPSVIYGLLAIALVGAGIFIGWLRPWQAEPAPRAVDSVAIEPAELNPRRAAPLPAAPEVALTAPLRRQALRPAPAPVAARPEARLRADASKRGPPSKPSADSGTSPMPAQSVDTGAANATPAQTVMLMAELPVAIQQELPPMSISVHAYSGKAKDRLVGINSKLLHEGDFAAPGLKLEQITPDGMIFSYRGYSFRRGVK
ncbi:MAG: general secretion pathway protein GspB [Pseudomonadota bacterium]